MNDHPRDVHNKPHLNVMANILDHLNVDSTWLFQSQYYICTIQYAPHLLPHNRVIIHRTCLIPPHILQHNHPISHISSVSPFT